MPSIKIVLFGEVELSNIAATNIHILILIRNSYKIAYVIFNIHVHFRFIILHALNMRLQMMRIDPKLLFDTLIKLSYCSNFCTCNSGSFNFMIIDIDDIIES
ncbi:hypothetical protein T11_5368 [Trichinella zimbabwensis]|uniref:Uncharacterized protein n=1 Tax=Trichinella zimbabwensis TaxID=268475 RepID=A0A0V1H953_9BILA|nr:hypothetical protein T11_5368 [Trichinella zimbabwensis]